MTIRRIHRGALAAAVCAALASPAAGAPTGGQPAPEAGSAAYRTAVASWYGPGLYGNRMACGRRLTRRTLGVAHRTLPCGTRVAVTFRGRSQVARVIDRGPFVGGREWDFTSALARRLHMRTTSRVGVLVVPRHR